MIDAKTVFLAILWLFTLVLPPVVVLALPVEAQSIIAGYVAAATQVVRLDPDHRRARARRALAADLSVPARQREAAHLDLDGVRDVDVRAAHDRHKVEGELAALDLGLAQVDLVTAHDRDGVDAADRAEPAARCEPPMMAIIQRTGRFVLAGCAWPPSWGRSLVSAASSPRVFAARARPDRSSSSSRVSRPTAA